MQPHSLQSTRMLPHCIKSTLIYPHCILQDYTSALTVPAEYTNAPLHAAYTGLMHPYYMQNAQKLQYSMQNTLMHTATGSRLTCLTDNVQFLLVIMYPLTL